MKRSTMVGSLTNRFNYYMSIDTSTWAIGVVVGNDIEDFSIELWIGCITTSIHYNKKALREEASL